MSAVECGGRIRGKSAVSVYMNPDNGIQRKNLS